MAISQPKMNWTGIREVLFPTLREISRNWPGMAFSHNVDFLTDNLTVRVQLYGNYHIRAVLTRRDLDDRKIHEIAEIYRKNVNAAAYYAFHGHEPEPELSAQEYEDAIAAVEIMEGLS